MESQLIYRVRTPSGEPTFALRDGERFKQLKMGVSELFDAMVRGEPLLPGESFVMSGATPELLAPTVATKVVCVGLNYARHAEEMGKALPSEPLLFTKPVSAIIGGAGAQIELPEQSELVHHEGELAVVIGRRAKRVRREEAMGYVLGYTCANDVTARDIQRREQRYTRAKGFDTFCPLGPALVLASGFEPSEHTLVCRVNGEVRQRSALNDWIFGIDVLIEAISAVMTLEPGDVILTGTPAGVGPLEAGDAVDVEIDGIGVLHNRVVWAERSSV